MRLAAFIAALSVAASPALAADLTVPLDQTARVSVAGSAATVVVGNSSVVDALVVDRRNILLVGRGYGVTNVMVMDGLGRTLLNKTVQVSPEAAGRVTLFRGVLANNFNCSPRCERTPLPGEDNRVFESFNQPYETYQQRAAGTTPPPAGGDE